ncbi:ribosome small subunit-dependent GTPase A [Kordiimonas aquimaris]|uniref:ribosome small subunit-dependent GTPase A n=1 Tax=Kordiimonas aquimaris TaxID=707591 RepID=UPI0021D2830A|nr:ribosome small subunit-dependent GTPase A [Kordiimonas aquimaris]
MARDYSQFLTSLKKNQQIKTDTNAQPAPSLSILDRLGWSTHFSTQVAEGVLTKAPPENHTPVRVTEVHRAGLRVMGEDIEQLIPPNADLTVGDWLLLNTQQPSHSQRLERKSLFKRRAPGTDRQTQLIAANVDTVFIVSSCNNDFNVARLERYIALAVEAEVDPVIILTKSDLTDTPEEYERKAWALSDHMPSPVPVLVLDARGGEPHVKLVDWCKPGQTLAFMGSSGVGKSTLVNALSETVAAETQAIREDDSKGRHTTTARALHMLPAGYCVLDTPGMRELQMTDVADGIAGVFADLHALASTCKFNDCGHESEPGCAVLAAVKAGTVEPARLKRWKKLVTEEQFNAMSLAERRSKDKAFGKIIKEAVSHKKR